MDRTKKENPNWEREMKFGKRVMELQKEVDRLKQENETLRREWAIHEDALRKDYNNLKAANQRLIERIEESKIKWCQCELIQPEARPCVRCDIHNELKKEADKE